MEVSYSERKRGVGTTKGRRGDLRAREQILADGEPGNGSVAFFSFLRAL